ncbi:hypothetical protein BH23ACT5_BH23ACT5_14010 [soil metagenome]
MRKLASLLAVAALAASLLVVPFPGRPVHDAPPPLSAAPFTVCPLGEAARRSTTLVMASGAATTAQVMVLSAGEVVVDESWELGAPGTAALTIEDFTGLTFAPALISLPQGSADVATVLVGGGVEALPCQTGSSDTVSLPGGVTTEGESFTVVLVNPFAGQARVTVGASSEVGIEGDPSLERIVVPARSMIRVDLSSLLPGRQSMSATVTVLEGRVAAAAVQEGGGDLAAWNAIAADDDWYLPLPAVEGVGRSLVLAAPGTAEVAFQLDVYGPDGLVEAAFSGTVPARGHEVIPVGDFLDGPGGVRVVAVGPLAATLRMVGEGARAVVPALSTPGPSWVLAGPGLLGDVEIQVLNPSDFDVEAELSTFDDVVIDTVTLPAGSLSTITVPEGEDALRLEGDGDIVVTWTVVTDAGVAAGAAVPAGAGAAFGE